MNILEELWYGRVYPIKTEDYRDEEYQELTDLFGKNKGNLLPTLNETQKEDLQKMEDIWEEMETKIEYAAFAKGFRLAVQLMAASV